MSATILDGRAIALKVRAEVAQRAQALRARGIVPGLVVILAGDDPASAVYVRSKGRAAEACGIAARTVRFGADVSFATLQATVAELNADPAVHGILIQLPLPPGVSAEQTTALLEQVDPAKDVDGFHPQSLGHLVAG
ncbi:MAG: bifunctional methylenetetrahydrofolate dehydrogenase/methenyltetrahydrofolate cyclohydrolase, partial [Myxococcales bacterium]|nr:bifunctional methylenetetrahydrofolate dehydrogenase/methenyltetrahydrofolate cyclohydrolase [Myxococcales bacterium]